MHEIRTQGPVEAVMEVYTDFFMYASGVYQVQMMTMSVMSKKMMMMRMLMLMMIMITVMEFMFRLCKYYFHQHNVFRERILQKTNLARGVVAGYHAVRIIGWGQVGQTNM